MPHDAKGNLLVEGDSVIIHGVVKQITSQGEKDCNVTVSVVSDFDEYKPDIAMNSKNVEKKTQHA